MSTLVEQVLARRWYHVLDLPGGITTPGWFDVRPTVERVGLPASLAGKRCLDVGTWDGFWAFEMERRGADEVVAADILDHEQWDWPPELRVTGRVAEGLAAIDDFRGERAAFEIAHEALGSSVRHRDVNVYDVSPETVGGQFDLVIVGSLLLHLRDPVAALAAVRTVVRGELIVADTVEAVLTWLRPRTPTARLEGRHRPWWWQPNRAALVQMVRSAGFEVLDVSSMYYLPLGPGHPRTRLAKLLANAVRSPHGREELIMNRKGIPHVAVRARPL